MLLMKLRVSELNKTGVSVGMDAEGNIEFRTDNIVSFPIFHESLVDTLCADMGDEHLAELALDRAADSIRKDMMMAKIQRALRSY
jgi:hypothetical protein